MSSPLIVVLRCTSTFPGRPRCASLVTTRCTGIDGSGPTPWTKVPHERVAYPPQLKPAAWAKESVVGGEGPIRYASVQSRWMRSALTRTRIAERDSPASTSCAYVITRNRPAIRRSSPSLGAITARTSLSGRCVGRYGRQEIQNGPRSSGGRQVGSFWLHASLSREAGKFAPLRCRPGPAPPCTPAHHGRGPRPGAPRGPSTRSRRSSRALRGRPAPARARPSSPRCSRGPSST